MLPWLPPRAAPWLRPMAALPGFGSRHGCWSGPSDQDLRLSDVPLGRPRLPSQPGCLLPTPDTVSA